MEPSANLLSPPLAGANRAAFGFLVEQHSPSLLRLAFRLTGNQQDAEDLVQETFLRAYKELDKFDGRSSMRTWLHRICLNCSIDLLRARKTRREQQPHNPESDMPSLFDRLATSSPSPERLTWSAQIWRMLQPALRGLTPMERTAFLLRHHEGADIEYIALALGVRANTAKQTVFRAVQKLRRQLKAVHAGAAIAAGIVLCIAFLSGRWSTRPTQVAPAEQASGLSEADRRAVLRGAISDHLQRSEILLAQAVHATPEQLSAAEERARARNILEDNRLLRQAAARAGDRPHAQLLDDLERVFLDLANTPDQLTPAEITQLRQRLRYQQVANLSHSANSKEPNL
jgi:RNA polymerase sigma-70 factor (ECF subfamily)